MQTDVFAHPLHDTDVALMPYERVLILCKNSIFRPVTNSVFSRERNNPSLYQPKSGKKLSKDDIKAHLTNTIRPFESRLKTVSSF
jgi:hypothetical protein